MVPTKLTYFSSRFVLLFVFFDKSSNKIDYNCKVCDKLIRPKSRYKHFKSNTHEEVDNCKHIKLTFKNLDINNVDRSSHEYNIQHKKNYDNYLANNHFELVFKDNQFCPCVTSTLFEKKTTIFCSNFKKK